MAQGQERRIHRRGARHIWRKESELTPAQAIYQREIGMWMHKHDMTYGQARRDLAFQAYRNDLRFYERQVRRNIQRGVPAYTGINIGLDGGYARALKALGYRQEQDPWYTGDQVVGSKPLTESVREGYIAEIMGQV